MYCPAMFRFRAEIIVTKNKTKNVFKTCLGFIMYRPGIMIIKIVIKCIYIVLKYSLAIFLPRPPPPPTQAQILLEIQT